MPKLVLVMLLLGSMNLNAQLLEEAKREPIDELMQIFQSRQLSIMLAQNLTQTMVTALSEKYGQLDPAVADLIFDEAKTIMYEEYILNGKLNDIFYDLYDQYYTAKELRDLVKFYTSPTGKRMLEVGDLISRQSLNQAKEHARKIAPKAQQRIHERLLKASKALNETKGP